MSVFLDDLHPAIELHTVELIPHWDEYPDEALSAILYWLEQLDRPVKILAIRLCIPAREMLQSEEWLEITEILHSKFTQVEQLVLQLRPPLPLGLQCPKASELAHEIEGQLNDFARRGRVQFEVAGQFEEIEG